VSSKEEFAVNEKAKDIKIVPSLPNVQKDDIKEHIKRADAKKTPLVKKSNVDLKPEVQKPDKPADSAAISEPPKMPIHDPNDSNSLKDEVFSLPDDILPDVVLTEDKEGENKVRHVVIEIPPDMEGRLDISTIAEKKNKERARHIVIEIPSEPEGSLGISEPVKDIMPEADKDVLYAKSHSVPISENGIYEERKAEPEPQTVKATVLTAAGLSIPDIFVLKDIRIGIFFEGSASSSDISVRLLHMEHPKEKFRKDGQKEIDINKEEGEGNVKKAVYSVLRAEKGIYILELINKGKDIHSVQIVFFLYEKTNGQRIREFRSQALYPENALHIKFLLPESVFWDDDDYFSGSIEDSNSITKFNHGAGIVWKERK